MYNHTKRADHADNLIRHTQNYISLLTQTNTTHCIIQIKLSNNHFLTLHDSHQSVSQTDLTRALSFLFSDIIHRRKVECKLFFKILVRNWNGRQSPILETETIFLYNEVIESKKDRNQNIIQEQDEEYECSTGK